jgi:hypothetical protein
MKLVSLICYHHVKPFAIAIIESLLVHYLTSIAILHYIITKSELAQLKLDHKSRPQKPTNGGPWITKSSCTQGHTEKDNKKTWTHPNSAPPTLIVAMKHLKKVKWFAIELKKQRIKSKQELKMNIKEEMTRSFLKMQQLLNIFYT